MIDSLSVTLIHALPGRVRMRLSQPPVDEPRLIEALSGHTGILSVGYTRASRSILVTYGGSHLTTHELMLRTAIALSADKGESPVKVLVAPRDETMTDGAVLAAFLLAGIAALRWTVPGGGRRLMDHAAGSGVALAVAEHAWREAREQGYFHPELLSLGYLTASYFNGRVFRGAVITWIASFGRHLLSGEERCIEVRPMGRVNGREKGYQVAMARQPSRDAPLLNLLRSVLQMAGIASFAGGYDSFLGELQNIASAHGEVLEGMAGLPKGIPIVINQEETE
ncbi:MAG: hypothetical protein MI863_12895 [Desulfobacterales bacterium]|nr:hypothetical protein [Desulfobacterales bacterium]